MHNSEISKRLGELKFSAILSLYLNKLPLQPPKNIVLRIYVDVITTTLELKM